MTSPSSTAAPNPEQPPPGSRHKLPASPVRKPDWDAFMVRAVWRALRPVHTPEQQRRRAASRQTVKKVSKGFGCALICLVVLAAALVGLVLLRES